MNGHVHYHSCMATYLSVYCTYTGQLSLATWLWVISKNEAPAPVASSQYKIPLQYLISSSFECVSPLCIIHYGTHPEMTSMQTTWVLVVISALNVGLKPCLEVSCLQYNIVVQDSSCRFDNFSERPSAVQLSLLQVA